MSRRLLGQAQALGYDVRSVATANGFQRSALVRCPACPATLEIPLKGPTTRPDLLAHRVERKGWEFDPFNRSRIACPDCIAARAARRRGESGKSSPGDDMTTSTALPPDKTALTVEERTRVRDCLLGTFDEKTGAYSEGWSDLRVAEQVGGGAGQAGGRSARGGLRAAARGGRFRSAAAAAGCARNADRGAGGGPGRRGRRAGEAAGADRRGDPAPGRAVTP